MRAIAREAGIGHRHASTGTSQPASRWSTRSYRDPGRAAHGWAPASCSAILPPGCGDAALDGPVRRLDSRPRTACLDTLLTMIESGEIDHAQTRTELLAAITTILDAGRAAGDLRSDVNRRGHRRLPHRHLHRDPPRPAHEAKASRLLNLLMDGLRARRPGQPKPGSSGGRTPYKHRHAPYVTKCRWPY